MDMNRLKNELIECRESGFAADMGELQPGINAVSVPIFGLQRRIAGCIILIGTFPEDRIESLGAKAVSTAKQISYRMGGNI